MPRRKQGDRRPRGAQGAARLLAATRVRDWWFYKLAPPLAWFWATAFHLELPLLDCRPQAAALLGAVAACAAYVCLINDLFDRDDDRRAGKADRQKGFSRAALGLTLAATIAGGLLFAWSWRHDMQILAVYAGSWLAFLAYSAPPIRLKTRGVPGILADTFGANVFPNLLAVLLAADAAGRAPGALWIAAICTWSFGWGLRGIVWHQIADRDADLVAGVRTFAVRWGPNAAARLASFFALPLELAALAILFWQSGTVLPALLLLLYLWVVALRERLWAAPPPALFLDEFYDGVLPFAFLLAAATANPRDLWLAVPLLLLFGRRPSQLTGDLWNLLLTAYYGFRRQIGHAARKLLHR